MTKRISRKDELPEWFCLDDYEKISLLSDDDILLQLIGRRDAFNDCSEIECQEFIDYYFSMGVVKESDNYSYSFKDNEFVKNYSHFQLQAKGAIRPLDLITVSGLYKKSQAYIEENNIKRSLRGQKRSVTSTVDNSEYMYLGINLDWPDELIIKDLAHLLPLWRERLSRLDDAQVFTSQSWDVIKRKIFDYNVFPMVDLLTWARWSGIRITKGVLSVALFPDGRYDYTNITQTINPFVENLMKDFSIEKYRREIMHKN